MNQLHLREEEFMRKERSENDSFEGRSNFDDFSLASRFHLYEPGEGGGDGGKEQWETLSEAPSDFTTHASSGRSGRVCFLDHCHFNRSGLREGSWG